ncbi:MAG: alpha/beta fold hydrolase [Bacteroidales bacterium]|jgi:lysophospholipase|nr:alpha/beta fold hydrolase [Bacteroidales bacterium]
MRTRIISLLAIGLIASIFQLACFAQVANITSTIQLQDEAYCQKIENLYDDGIEGKFEGKNSVSIYYKYFRQAEEERGSILISSGRTEAALKFKEVIFDLYTNGYSVYIFDHRGPGLSGRMAEDPHMGYVDDFQYYIDDMKQFYDEFVKPGKHEKNYMLSHSLGGAISMSYLEQHPKDFDAAAFSSPMLGLASYICPLAKILNSKTPKYAPGQGGYSDDSTKFEGNDVTGCKIRYYRKIAENNKVKESRLGGASVQWLHQSCRMMKGISKNVSTIETPIFIFMAQNESVVNSKSTEKFIQKAEKAGKTIQACLIEDAQHEILMEKDKQRTEMIQKTLDFFAEY